MMTAKISEQPWGTNVEGAKLLIPSSPTCLKPEILRRHVFVRLAEDAWALASVESGDVATLRDWLAKRCPLIVRRPCLSDDGREVFLGLALPGKRRMAFRVPVEQVRSVELPPLWTENTATLAGFPVRLFGSHAWQKLTGLSYVTETSDVDLLLDIHNLEEWERLLALEFTFPPHPRIDLEIILRGDASFSWREYMGTASEILIKSNRVVWLEQKDRLADFFP